MSSHRDPRFTQNKPRQNHLHAPTNQGMTQHNSEAFFIDYTHGNPEHLVAGGYQSTFGAGGLARLGPEYHPTNTPSAASSSAFGQPDYSFATAGSTTLSTARVRSREHPNVFPLNTSQPAFPPAATLVDWRLSPYTTDAVSPNVPVSIAAHSLSTTAGVIGYASQPNVTDPYMGDYVSPTAPLPPPQQPGFDFQPWPAAVDDGTMSLGTASPSSLMSPVMQSYEMVASPTGSGIDESSMGMYGGASVENWQLPPQPPSRTDSIEMGTSSPGGGGKRAKQYAEQSGASPVTAAPKSGAGNSTTTAAKTKLRSASRTSKNMQTRTEETPQERKSRNSHNLVEKQYRNRLNMQFEILMNTLPESMRSPTTTAFGADSDVGQAGGGQGGAGLDLGERRLSKAQVLDMSTRYIRSLEKEREKLEREREELLLGMAKMREAYEKDGTSGPGSGTGGGKGKGAAG
ncbi:uncharacterized protein QC764_708680 [Podospora pseudoanserina]|uniref:BHLH domain-containing protein n=1 Tax=Podospora pseudoanserina TaxID=2609844 RepID=A0ABR0HLC4_9PEZI|nr:hypothetical protein QC764_708680 [Podospora pseudoanserina]